MRTKKIHQFYDPLYGHIDLTPVEYEIIDHPIYQRLRWIKQLGFTFYVFPGAEHTRFLHSIGVMHTATKLMMSMGMIQSTQDLMNSKQKYSQLAQHIRLAALLHDIGQFPFSHTVEMGYIQTSFGKDRSDNHEHLGAYIIRHSEISKILSSHNCDAVLISKIIKGACSHPIANQLLHSDVDADRLDYLYRDSLYTGIKYGNFDRDYIIYNARLVEDATGKERLAYHENAQQAIEGMLHSRFSWYSQVLKSNQGVKFDLVAGEIARYFIEQGFLPSFATLTDWAGTNSDHFFTFNDQYFLHQLAKQYEKPHPKKYKDLMQIILYRKTPKTIRSDQLIPQICKNDADFQHKFKRVTKLMKEFESLIKDDPEAWILYDPEARVNFCSHDEDQKVFLTNNSNSLKKLSSHPASTISMYETIIKLIPNIYCNQVAYNLITKNLN